MHEELIISLLIITTGCILLHAAKNPLSLWLKTALVFLMIICGWAYSDFGKFHEIRPHDKAYVSSYGNTPKKTLLHWHENYHYYLGAKYYYELGYKGLYETIAYADSQSQNPFINAHGMRSLRDPTHHITLEEGQRRGREEFRPNFTEFRWLSFTNDVESMKAVAGRDWFNIGQFDAGYNPPPTWALFGTTIANLISISEQQAWLGDMRPAWYQIEWLTMPDLLLLAAGMWAVTWAFGWMGTVTFALFFLTSEPASMRWITGGFLRFTWLAELMIGLSCLKKRHYVAAGISLGLCSMDRIFPAAFMAAAALALLGESMRHKNFAPLRQFVVAAATTMGIMFGLSVLMFGTQLWAEFIEKIIAHKDLYFVNHIGYRRIAVFGPEVPGQNFWWEKGLDNFRDWNTHLNAKWQEVRNMHMIIWGILLAAAAFASFRARAEEAALMLGGLIFFLLEIPANYYYVYFPLIAVVFAASSPSRLRTPLTLNFILLWLMLNHDHYLSKDELINNYYKCCAFLAFFCIWIVLRTGETLAIIFKEQQLKQKTA